MKVFLDECLDWRLAREIVGHDVRSAKDMGWRGIKNGAPLRRVAAEFDVFVSVDSKLPFQQDIKALPVAIVVLRCRRIRLPDLRALVPDLLTALAKLPERQVTLVG